MSRKIGLTSFDFENKEKPLDQTQEKLEEKLKEICLQCLFVKGYQPISNLIKFEEFFEERYDAMVHHAYYSDTLSLSKF